MNWTTWSVSILTWTSTSWRSLLQPRERCWPGRRSRQIRVATGGAALRGRGANGGRAWAIEGTGSYGAGLARYLAGRGESGARGQPHTTNGAPPARQRRRARRGPHGTGGTCQRDARPSAQRGATRGAAVVVGRTPKRRRRTPRSARTASRRDRHRPRPAPRRAADARPPGCSSAAAASAARTQPPTSSRHGSSCAASPARINAATQRSGRAQARDPQPCTGPRARAARRARRRPDRRRATNRCLITPRPAALRSLTSHASQASPVLASSGKTTRHRLSRGGDRQLNRALHTVVLHRRQHDAATKDYIARRIAEGKTRREATRLLKRYLARHLYRLLQQTEPLMA